MDKLKYKVLVPGAKIYTKKWGFIFASTLTNEIAEYLLATKKYDDIIGLIDDKEDGSKKSVSKVN